MFIYYQIQCQLRDRSQKQLLHDPSLQPRLVDSRPSLSQRDTSSHTTRRFVRVSQLNRIKRPLNSAASLAIDETNACLLKPPCRISCEAATMPAARDNRPRDTSAPSLVWSRQVSDTLWASQITVSDTAITVKTVWSSLVYVETRVAYVDGYLRCSRRASFIFLERQL